MPTNKQKGCQRIAHFTQCKDVFKGQFDSHVFDWNDFDSEMCDWSKKDAPDSFREDVLSFENRSHFV